MQNLRLARNLHYFFMEQPTNKFPEYITYVISGIILNSQKVWFRISKSNRIEKVCYNLSVEVVISILK